MLQENFLTPAGNSWGVLTLGEGAAFRIYGGSGSVLSQDITAPHVADPNGNGFFSGSFTVAQSVPEPATLTLCGIGVGRFFLARYARSKRRKHAHM